MASADPLISATPRRVFPQLRSPAIAFSRGFLKACPSPRFLSIFPRPQRRTRQAYGLIWPGKYDVYQNWENTLDQRREMLAYDMIDGFEQCDPPGSRASHEGGDVD